jgi:hypothetical protein
MRMRCFFVRGTNRLTLEAVFDGVRGCLVSNDENGAACV